MIFVPDLQRHDVLPDEQPGQQDHKRRPTPHAGRGQVLRVCRGPVLERQQTSAGHVHLYQSTDGDYRGPGG